MTEKDALWVTHRNAPLFNRAECTHYEKSLILAMTMKSLGLFDVIWASPDCVQYSIARTKGPPRDFEKSR